MSATVDIHSLQAQLHNRKAIAAGLFLQFGIMPFLGFLVVKLLDLDNATGVTLLVVTSSPGGSYSNWFCSLFNADLALSVFLTGISTVLSIVLLPLNLAIYTRLIYYEDMASAIEWRALILALATVIIAIGLGLFASAHYHSHTFNIHANWLGNVAGFLLVILSAVVANSDGHVRAFDREWQFYMALAIPCLAGLIIANVLATGIMLLKPERMTIAIECSVQNVGIATSFALAMFQGENLARAVAVPFFYGIFTTVVLVIYSLAAWKMSWSKAPADVSLANMLFTSYEVLNLEKCEDEKDDEWDYVEHTDADVSNPPGVMELSTTNSESNKAEVQEESTYESANV